MSHKALAKDTAALLPGVKNVDNRLEPKTLSNPEQNNEWIAMKIKTALLFHRNVSLANTNVYVEENIVTLRGKADSEAQKELTGTFANVAGVREVRNEMTVTEAPVK